MSVTQNDVFHADVHGGNLLVLENGKIGFIDFGIVGKVSEKVWIAVGSLIQSLILENYQGMAQALVDMGATKSKVDIPKFAEEIEIVVKRITSLQPEINIVTDGTNVGAQIAVDDAETTKIVLEIVGVAENNGLKLPREFGLLLKQALYFDRYQKLLAPTLDPLRDSRVRESLSNEMNNNNNNNNYKEKKTPIIDVEIV
jgi:aarF domain-containing kinase